eukprot:CAMPEP_0202701140 /NCGR_PEP_ID=MMETSP1385-20130828/14246_1 /ASSEMBLY_ACC=CAM_ASM_000861 /TAXON_ID=933848 /ORGANISM="Elphidium margaritaceum" /LENGTH=811 /DNA_ID=CAMNT_0049358491 /DNA_START=248 /DNA_END=2683 /DNA_ORIENTATION=-
MAIETPKDGLQPLEIGYAQTAYYPHHHHHHHHPHMHQQHHAAPAQRSAPVHNTMQASSSSPPQDATSTTCALFGKAPQCELAKDLNAMNISKPPETPSTPPPPPPPTLTQTGSAKAASTLSVTPHKVDITSITPQSHTGAALANSNSASNHSTASNHTTATTALESAASQSSRNGAVPKGDIPPPQLTHPLPAVSVPNASSSKLNNVVTTAAVAAAEGIVIPMPHTEYNAWLSHMYGAQPPPPQQQAPASYVPNATTSYPDAFGGYDTPYGMYPSSNGYYPHQHGGSSAYYQAPNTAPAHMAPPPPHAQHQAQYPSSTPKSADAYGAFQTYGSYDASAPAATFYHTAPVMTQADLSATTTTDARAVQYLHRADGTLISPHTNLAHVRPIVGGKDESDPFTAGDDALFGDAMVTIINVHWESSIPFATVRIHQSNRIYHVPLMDLTPLNLARTAKNAHLRKTIAVVHGNGSKVHQSGATTVMPTTGANRYRLGMQGMKVGADGGGVMEHAHAHTHAHGMQAMDVGATFVRRNPKLSDETLMKLPHLRKHREYIRSIDLNMGPRDYNSFRVSVNSKHQGHGEDETGGDGSAAQQPGATPQHQHAQQQHQHQQQHHQQAHPHYHAPPPHQQQYAPPPTAHAHSQHAQAQSQSFMSAGGNSGRTANIQNLGLSNKGNLNLNNLNAGNQMAMGPGGGRGRRNKRMSVCEKGDLFKTELCENWVKKGHCTYGKKCHFAHGREDVRTRWRIENYKTQPCCDPARADSRLCLFGKRCNYAHPGEPLRRSHHCLYLDEEYEAEIVKDFGQNTPYPFGIYI